MPFWINDSGAILTDSSGYPIVSGTDQVFNCTTCQCEEPLISPCDVGELCASSGGIPETIYLSYEKQHASCTEIGADATVTMTFNYTALPSQYPGDGAWIGSNADGDYFVVFCHQYSISSVNYAGLGLRGWDNVNSQIDSASSLISWRAEDDPRTDSPPTTGRVSCGPFDTDIVRGRLYTASCITLGWDFQLSQ